MNRHIAPLARRTNFCYNLVSIFVSFYTVNSGALMLAGNCVAESAFCSGYQRHSIYLFGT